MKKNIIRQKLGLSDLTRSQPVTGPFFFSALRYVLIVATITSTFLILGAAYGYYRFGSMYVTVLYLRGQRLLVSERVKTIDGVRVGDSVYTSYTLTNISSKPIQIVGMISSCSCTMIEGLPSTIPSYSKKIIRAKISVSEKTPIDFKGTLKLFTDDIQSSEIDLAYTVRVETAFNARLRQDK